MNPAFFVTGTDTEIGKTYCSAGLLRAAVAAGRRAVGLKPVAAGAQRGPDGVWRNEDALALIAASNVALDYSTINPYCLPAPISPHLAAHDAGVEIEPAVLQLAFAQARAAADWILVEGAGGWRVPLSESLEIADLAAMLRLPVLLVVGLRLGCINHAQLTRESIERRGLELAGWIANTVDPAMMRRESNVDTLAARLGSAPLAVIPRDPPADLAAGLFSVAFARLSGHANRSAEEG